MEGFLTLVVKRPGVLLSDPTEILPPLWRDACRTLQTIAATPPNFSVKMAFRNPKTGLKGEGVSQKKLASEAYRSIGGTAWNSIANGATMNTKVSLVECFSGQVSGVGVFFPLPISTSVRSTYTHTRSSGFGLGCDIAE